MNTTTTNIRRRVGLGAMLAAFTVFAGCTADVTETGAPEIVGDWGDPELYPEMGGAFGQYLTALDGTIAFDSTTGALTVTGNAAAVQTIIIGRRAIDNAILVNGAATTNNNVLATSATVKSVGVTATTGAQVLVLDFLNGLFGTATSSGGGFTIDLGADSDALHIRGTTGNDRFTFGDTGISFNTDTNREIGATATVEAYNVSMAGGNDIFSAQGGAYGTGDNPFGTLVTVYGGTGNDTITGTNLADVLNGGEGDDTLWGMGAADVLNGDAGNDTFEEGTAANGGDTFNGGAGTDTVNYGSRAAVLTVTIDGTANDGDGVATENDDVEVDVENVTGGSAGDTITGSAEANVIRGGGGNDTITGGAGDDTLYGDDGDDTFDELDAASGADVFNGGAGTDTVDYSGRSNALTVTMNGTAADDGEAAEGDDVNADVENLMDGSGNDNITGNNADNVFIDGGGDDTFSGGNGNDTLDAGTADDGADTFNGGAGIDFVDYSGRVADVTVTMADGLANDGLTGEEDNIAADVENIDGASGAVVNTITGNDLDNIINGGGGDDVIDGGAGNDILYGAAGADQLTGGTGDDTLDGGAGEDILDCGAGDDVATNEGSAVTDPVTIYLVDCELG